MGGTGVHNYNIILPNVGVNLGFYGPSSLNCYVYGNDALSTIRRNYNN